MSKFLKSLFLLLTAGVFTTTGWAVLPEPWAAWDPIQTGAPLVNTTVGGVSSSGWRMDVGGGTYSNGMITTSTSGKAPFIDIGNTTTNFGYGNPITLVATINVNTADAGESICPLITFANWQYNDGFALTLKSVSEEGGIVFGAATSATTSFGSPSLKEKTISVESYTPGTDLKLAIFLSSEGVQLYTVDGTTATLVDTWSDIAYETLRANRITFGAPPDSNATVIFALKGLAIYPNANATTPLDFSAATTTAATISGTMDASKITWEPSEPTAQMDAELMVDQASTLTMDKSITAHTLKIDGTGYLTIATDGTNKLKATTTKISTDTTVEAGAASLGAVTLEDEKTITVADTTTVTSLTTTRGVLATSADMTITRDTGFFSGLKVLKVVGGTLTSDVTDSNGNNLTYGRDVIVTGASSNLVINKGDGTGWNSGNNSITLTEGGKLTYNYRDTLKSPFKMSGGTVKFVANCANGSGRALDVYNSNASVNDFTVTALDGATVENPTVSYITALAEESDTSGNRKILLRDGDMIVDVAETAKLHVVAELISVMGNAGGTRGKLVKNGTGVLELAGLANIHETGTNINAGVLILSNQATLGSGTTTIAENAQLVIKQGTNKLTNTLTNNGTITADTATVDLTGATISGSGTYDVTNNGTLILKAGTENGASVTSGTLTLLLSETQLAKGYTANVASGTVVTFIKAGASGYETVAEDVTKYELPAKESEELSVTVGEGDGQSTAWSGVADLNYVYKNATLAIHFTANNQTFTFDNTLGVALTSLTVTAEAGVTGCTIELPATEGLVIATATVINTDVTVTGQGALGVATVASDKTLTLNGPIVTSAAGQGKLVKAGSGDLALDGSIANLISAYEVSAGKLTISNGGYYNAYNGGLQYSGTPFYQVGSDGHLVLDSHDLIGWNRSNTVTVAEVAGILEKTRDENETFSGRLLLKDSGELRLSAANDKFMLHNSAIIAVDNGASAKIAGNRLKMNGGTPEINVGENATLSGETFVELGTATKKTGAGLWVQKKAFSGNGALTIEGGTLRIDVNKGNDAANYAQMFTEGKVISVAQGAILDLHNGYGYFATAGVGLTKVTGDFYYGISGGNGTNTIATALEVTNGSTLYIRDWRAYQLTPPALRLDGAIVSENYGTTKKNFVVAPTILSGNGTIGTNELPIALSLPENGTIDAEHGAVAVTGTVTLPAAMTVKITEAQNVAGSVILLNAADVTIPEGQAVTVMVGEAKGKKLYTVTHDADADIVKLTVAERTVKDALTAEVPAGGTLTLAGALGDYALATEGATLIIDFGDKGEGDAVPGTFTFNNEEAITLTSITVQGTNGGTIVMADGAGRVTTAALTLSTTVSADAAFYAANTGAISGTGKLCLASGELTLDEANTYTGGTDIAAGAKLTITNAGAISTGTITGAGTLVCDGFMPRNASLTDATNWTGTLTLNGINPSQKEGYTLYNLGNASSVLELANFAEAGDDVYLNEGNTLPFTLKVTGTNYFTNGNSNRVIEIAKIAGSGTLVLKGAPTETWKFLGVASDFSGGITVEGGRSVVLGAGNSAGSGKITITGAINIATATLTAVSGVEVASAGTLSGTGTIDSALTLANDATIDTTGGAVKVAGAVTLPDALTVKIAAAPAVGTAVPLLNASNVTIPDGMDVTVMVGDTPAEGTYQLIKTSTALLLDNVLAEDVTIVASNIGAAQLYEADQMGNYDSYGVQVDLDGATPYAPGWVAGAHYPLTSFAVVHDSVGSVAVGTCVQVVDADNPSVVVATSAPLQTEDKESVTVTSSNTTNNYTLCTFKFEAPVYVDAAKTYQFRFVNGEGTAVACKIRALYTSDANGGGDNQRYCNWLNAQYEVITAVAPRYVPYTVLTAERIVDNSPICRGGDETLEVTTVPEKIRLDTTTFGYGSHTVLQYTGGTTDWSTMDVEGLPEGAEIIKTDTTWGFAIKTLNVLTVGDSITAGLVTYYNSSANWHVPGGYRLPLYKRLTRAGYTVKYLGTSDVFGTSTSGIQNPEEANPSPSLGENVHHEGHSGARLNQMITRFSTASVKAVIAEQGVPDVITLHLGTNDFGMDGDTVDNALAEMKRLIYMLNGSGEATGDKPLYPNATIFVAKIMPRADDGLMTNKIGPFNEQLATYVTSLASDKLVLVDLGMANDYGLLRHDGLHPSTEGYAQMAKAWFEAIDTAFEPFGEATDAPTPVTSIPTADVTESDRTGNSKTKGVLKAAEWTTFAEFKTGYLSQFGYMLDSERPWQLDVRGENTPEVTDGVLSLNGAPLTVNPVDGRIGTTASAYTIVMQVSNLAANDVIFTDSAVQCTDWPNAKGTANADLGVLTVVDADTLKWTYNGLADGPEINLADVNLTDSTPDVIAITVANNQCKVAVNGGDAVTVSQGNGSESYRGSWSIGSMSTADTGSSMKLYRLSFYEGAATVVIPKTTATISVGEGEGQYTTWSAAKVGLNLADEMTELTIDFGDVDGEAVPGTFTFGEGDVTLGSLIVTGSNGGTIAATGTVMVSTSATINTAVAVEGQIQLNGLTIAEGAELAITNYAVVGDQVSGAGTLKITGATLNRGFDADLVSNTWTGTVVLEDINDNLLDLRYLVNDSITSTEGVLTVTASSSITIEGTVKAYIYDGAIKTLTLNGDFQMANGTTNKSYTQCVTVDNLAGAGAFIGHQSSEVYIAVNIKSWTNFTGSIDLSNEKSAGTIFFFGTAPEYFTTSITPGNVGAADSDFTEADYGTIYVTEGNLVTALGSTWKAPKVNIASGTSLTIQGWFGASESVTGLSANTIVGGVKNNEGEMVEAGVLDLRALDDLSGVNVTVKAGGRLLVKSGATVPDTIIFEDGAILGIAPASVDDIGSATLTVTAEGSAKTAQKIGYKTDGVTELTGWTDKDDDLTDNTLSFGYDPIFDGELCLWAYEFDTDQNTTATNRTKGPVNTGRDKTSLQFDGAGSTGRVLVGTEYHDDGEEHPGSIRVASSPWRTVTYPTAFTAATYGKLTANKNRIIMGFGSSYGRTYTVALATGASEGEVQLLLVEGHTGNTNQAGEWPEKPVKVLATTTVPNVTSENHLYAFSYEQKDGTTEIIFYVDGEKYQPYKVNEIITLGGGFQMGSIHGGWPTSLVRMNEDDIKCTADYLRLYDQVLSPEVLAAMAKEYSYVSKVGQATRTIVAGSDTTWHETTGNEGDWTQVSLIPQKNGIGEIVRDEDGNIIYTKNEDGTFAIETTKQDHPTYGYGDTPELGTQVVLNVDGQNTLYLNEFYTTTTDESGTVTTNGNAKLYYERLEINPVEGGEEDSLSLWAGRLNDAEVSENKDKQSAVITVLGYTKINTDVTMAHNVAFLSGPVAVAKDKTLTFDFSGFDVMKVPSMPVEYRLTGFLDEETRTRVTHNYPENNFTVNARSVELGYKTDVNQYVFKVDRYPVTAYFRDQDGIDLAADCVNASRTPINFNDLYYMWQGVEVAKQMDWDVDTIDAEGNHVDEHVLANFASVDAVTKEVELVTVTLDTLDDTSINLTLPKSALTKQVSHGDDNEGKPIWETVNMLGDQQLIVADKVTVDYTGEDAAELAPFVKAVDGMVRVAKSTFNEETYTTWPGNLTIAKGGSLSGMGTVAGKLVFEESATFDGSAVISAKDADFTKLKKITVDYDVVTTATATAGVYKLVGLEAGHTAKTLEGCTIVAKMDDGTSVTWEENDETKDERTLIVKRADGVYIVARPDVMAGDTVVDNNGLTLPLARRAAELSATKVKLTGVVNMADAEMKDVAVADAATLFTNVAFNMTETLDEDNAVEAQLKYDFGVTDIAMVTDDGTEYVVVELVVSNATDYKADTNTADFADGVTVDVSVTKDQETEPQALTSDEMKPVADMGGSTTNPVTSGNTRYIRFLMPDGNGTFKVKARATK